MIGLFKSKTENSKSHPLLFLSELSLLDSDYITKFRNCQGAIANYLYLFALDLRFLVFFGVFSIIKSDKLFLISHRFFSPF